MSPQPLQMRPQVSPAALQQPRNSQTRSWLDKSRCQGRCHHHPQKRSSTHGTKRRGKTTTDVGRHTMARMHLRLWRQPDRASRCSRPRIRELMPRPRVRKRLQHRAQREGRTGACPRRRCGWRRPLDPPRLRRARRPWSPLARRGCHAAGLQWSRFLSQGLPAQARPLLSSHFLGSCPLSSHLVHSRSCRWRSRSHHKRSCRWPPMRSCHRGSRHFHRRMLLPCSTRLPPTCHLDRQTCRPCISGQSTLRSQLLHKKQHQSTSTSQQSAAHKHFRHHHIGNHCRLTSS